MARGVVALALVLVALSGAHAQSSTSAASAAASETPAAVPSWAIFDPTAYTGFTNALQSQFQGLSANPSSFLSAVSPQTGGILGLGQAASQLVQDQPAAPQVALLTTQLADEVCQNATFVLPAEVPTQAVGPVFTYTISGGYCIINPTGTVSCKRPSITLQTDPAFVNLKGSTGTQIKDTSCSNVQLFGTGTNGTITGGKTVTYQIQDIAPSAPAPEGDGGAAASAAVSSSKPHKKPHKKPTRS